MSKQVLPNGIFNTNPLSEEEVEKFRKKYEKIIGDIGPLDLWAAKVKGDSLKKEENDLSKESPRYFDTDLAKDEAKQWYEYQAEKKTKEVKEPSNISQAFLILCDELKHDQGYFYIWQASIAMAIKDEFSRRIAAGKLKGDVFKDIHETVSEGAKNFLNQLIDLQ